MSGLINNCLGVKQSSNCLSSKLDNTSANLNKISQRKWALLTNLSVWGKMRIRLYILMTEWWSQVTILPHRTPGQNPTRRFLYLLHTYIKQSGAFFVYSSFDSTWVTSVASHWYSPEDTIQQIYSTSFTFVSTARAEKVIWIKSYSLIRANTNSWIGCVTYYQNSGTKAIKKKNLCQ